MVGIRGISLLCKEILEFPSYKLPARIGSFRRSNNLISYLYFFYMIINANLLCYFFLSLDKLKIECRKKY